MAKSDLLKEAIADANAVRETALANAKIALEEAFTPRIQSMLSAKLSEELEDEDEEGMEGAMRGDEMRGSEMREQEDEMDMEEPMEEPEMDEMEPEAGEEIGVAVDVDGDGEYDYEGELGAEEGEMEDMEMGDEMEDEGDLDLESIIRELEEDLNEEEEEEAGEEGMMKEEEEEPEAMEEDIDSIIEAILGEEEEEIEEQVADEAGDDGDGMLPEAAELEEAYATINQLRGVLQEVNLLNAKLLYTNKLFRNFELSENQKMKVIENFDRAGNTREVKLVFSTLAESFQKPAKKRVVKEHKNVASKAVGTTAPAKEIISEGNEMAARFKKLAGLL
jgi:hypothetical protein